MAFLYRYNLILNNEILRETYLYIYPLPNKFIKVFIGNKEEILYINNVIDRNIYLSVCN